MLWSSEVTDKKGGCFPSGVRWLRSHFKASKKHISFSNVYWHMYNITSAPFVGLLETQNYFRLTCLT